MTHTLDEVQEILFCSIIIIDIEVSEIHRQYFNNFLMLLNTTEQVQVALIMVG